MTYLTTAPERCDFDNTRTLWRDSQGDAVQRCVDIKPEDEWQQLGHYLAAGHTAERVPDWVEAEAA